MFNQELVLIEEELQVPYGVRVLGNLRMAFEQEKIYRAIVSNPNAAAWHKDNAVYKLDKWTDRANSFLGRGLVAAVRNEEEGWGVEGSLTYADYGNGELTVESSASSGAVTFSFVNGGTGRGQYPSIDMRILSVPIEHSAIISELAH